MKARNAAQHLDGGLQQNDGGRPVHVVVAVDQDCLLRLNRLPDAPDRSLHAQHRIGIEQMIELRMEKTLGLSRIAYAARHQQLGDQQRQPGLAGKRSCSSRITLEKYPAPIQKRGGSFRRAHDSSSASSSSRMISL